MLCGVVEHGLRQDVQLSMSNMCVPQEPYSQPTTRRTRPLLMQFDGSITVYMPWHDTSRTFRLHLEHFLWVERGVVFSWVIV